MISYYRRPTYVNVFDKETLFCTGKKYAMYENKVQATEKKYIGN